jgi:cyclopropane fatty-acyl-phospholipid synthase-like methyltransferase
MTIWHDDDAFWRAMAPRFFSADHWAAAPAEASAAVSLIGLRPGASVLDLACGPGRHSLALARMGLRATGVDRAEEFLAEGRARAAAEGLDIEFVMEDMRRFQRPGAFDSAFSFSTSFGYFEDPDDDIRTARNVLESLKPDGSFLVETMGDATAARDHKPHEEYDIDASTRVVEDRRIVREGTWYEKRRRIIRGGSLAAEFLVGHRLYSDRAIIEMLERSGFCGVRVFGGLDGRPYDARAAMLVAVARKAPGRGP